MLKYLVPPAVLALAVLAAAPETQAPAGAQEVQRQQYYALQITSVSPGSPADKAGLERGDVLVKADGKRLRSPADLRDALDGAYEVELVIINCRTGKYETVVVYPRDGKMGAYVQTILLRR